MLVLLFLCFFLFSSSVQAADSYADLVEDLMPSVVNISTERKVIENNDGVDNVMINPQLEGREALGSGFFIRNDGYILTNHHVIKGAKKITVVSNDNQVFDAKIIGVDEPSDLAVLKIESSNKDNKTHHSFKAVVFGNANDVRIGDKVLTFGNPYGLGVSVSSGIISAKSRNIGLGEQEYLQTDASINKGNSGGPMFNLDGEVIGVNAAIFTVQGASGIGFSLPSNTANWISEQLIKSGKVKRGWLGLTVSNGIDQYTGKSGFVVTSINEESSAYKEGLRVGDIITAYNKKPATDLSDFMKLTETMEPGQVLRLTTTSYGEEFQNIVAIQEMPASELTNVANKALIESRKYYHQSDDSDVFYISELKIAVKEADPRGLTIVKIDSTSPLQGKGISVGDVILEADRSDIYSADNLLDSIRYAAFNDYRPLSLLIQGVDNIFYSTIEMAREND